MKQRGQILILTFIFMGVILLITASLLAFVHQNVIATRKAVAKEQARLLAEAGIDKAVWQLNQTAGAYTGESNTALSTGAFDVAITNLSGTLKEIIATGYAPNKTNPLSKSQIKIQASIDTTTVSFNYGVQVGDGGLRMNNNARINGNVFSNGNIRSFGNSRITGDVFVADRVSSGFGWLQNEGTIQVDGTVYARWIRNAIIGRDAKGYLLADSTVGGNVFAYEIRNCAVTGNASYTLRSNCTVGGTITSPYPGEPDLDPLPFPITTDQINEWKAEAEAGGTIIGNYSLIGGETVSLGPKKITGDLILDNFSTLTLTGRLWVQGNIGIRNGARIILSGSYGTNSEVVVNDGWIRVQNNGVFAGSGTAGSYFLFANTNSCGNTRTSPCTPGGAAVELYNNAAGAVIFAQNGRVHLHNNVQLKELTAYGIDMDNNATITYETGLANVNFVAGPGASWQILRGTWRETE